LLSDIDARKPPRAVIFGLAGEALTDDETEFFRDANPLGFILFARNCKDLVKLKSLVRSLQEITGREVPVLIDQEGGRVQRLKPPFWKAYPSAFELGDSPPTQPSPRGGEGKEDTQALPPAGGGLGGGEAAAKQTVAEVAAAIADDLNLLGINVNCAPVLDVRYPQTHNALGDRAFSFDPVKVGQKGVAVCRTFLARGVIPVIKHMPGLGRAHLDTHHDLPAVAAPVEDMEKTDYVPFKYVLKQDFGAAVWGMVSHALYSALDPDTAATCSPAVIGGAIRKAIGFDGLLLSDDLSMGALSQYGDAAARAVKVLESGCDIALHCNGELPEMKLVAKRVPIMTSAAIMRYNRSVAALKEFTRESAA
jgi:beta-N-acetylhexosaminidase